MQEFLTDYQAATKFMKCNYHVYVLMSERNGYKNLVAVFDSENAAIIALDRCIVNDDSAQYYIEQCYTFDLHKLY